MKGNKKTNLNNSNPKNMFWRVGLISVFILTFGIFNFSCKNEVETEIENTDYYYVKYLVSSTTIYTGGKLNVTINNENNTKTYLTIDTRKQWETIIGPVKKNFNATLKVESTSENDGTLKLYTEIHVSKNDSPFALKSIDGSETHRKQVELSYIINY